MRLLCSFGYGKMGSKATPSMASLLYWQKDQQESHEPMTVLFPGKQRCIRRQASTPTASCLCSWFRCSVDEKSISNSAIWCTPVWMRRSWHHPAEVHELDAKEIPLWLQCLVYMKRVRTRMGSIPLCKISSDT